MVGRRAFFPTKSIDIDKCERGVRINLRMRFDWLAYTELKVQAAPLDRPIGAAPKRVLFSCWKLDNVDQTNFVWLFERRVWLVVNSKISLVLCRMKQPRHTHILRAVPERSNCLFLAVNGHVLDCVYM